MDEFARMGGAAVIDLLAWTKKERGHCPRSTMSGFLSPAASDYLSMPSISTLMPSARPRSSIES